MGGDSGHRPLVIVGPTASGKSALAMELARRARFRPDIAGMTELVSVDSMQVYRGMDIGTAKPTAAEQADVPHHLIDLVDPAERFTVVDYATAFEAAMSDIADRGAVPLLVGGTGLYLRAVIDGLTPPPEFPSIAAELEAEACAAGEPEGTVALHCRLAELDPLAASRMEPTNLRRIVRALSVCLGTGRPFSSYGPGLTSYAPVPYRIVGVEIDRDTLDQRIAQRYRQQIEAGFVEEVRRLMSDHTSNEPGSAAGVGDWSTQAPSQPAAPLSRTAAQALGYKELRAHLAGECTLDDALEVAIARTRRFARRQQRWFARDPRIIWIPHESAAEMADRVEQLEP
ncbi:tRNA (adenosine(37)-N6)-dimethylallyltransferase MiaA [Candidatus Poriferisodalis sp.]|uniref:tRNA (adenosine(37)-N6)-dimethylallyltransferase MiaA n=1 Tax=Candidatus Poriferisodalis sp. TaxID=3101277 RepID=UPI003B012C92